MKMRRLLPITAILVLALCLAACGASGGNSADAGSDRAPAASAAPVPYPDFGGGDMTAESHQTPSGGAGESKVYTSQDAKLIRTASLTIQSTEFDAAVTALDKLVIEQGGYYESAEVQQGAYYDAGSARYGSYVVRVPKENYTAFLSATGGVGHVVSKNESTQDVGEAYYDAEARLKTLETKHERLLALLEKAVTMEDIVSLENALSDTEYEIDQYSTTLRRYDSLVGYATISITLNEVLKLTEPVQETATLSGRIGNALSAGLSDFGEGLENFAVWIAYHLIGVVLFLAIAAAAWVTAARIRRKRRAGTAPKTEESKPSQEKK